MGVFERLLAITLARAGAASAFNREVLGPHDEAVVLVQVALHPLKHTRRHLDHLSAGLTDQVLMEV